MTTSYSAKPEEPTLVWIECWNCGTPVQVWVPFVGCVYCGKCSSGSTEYSIGSEEFTPSYA